MLEAGAWRAGGRKGRAYSNGGPKERRVSRPTSLPVTSYEMWERGVGSGGCQAGETGETRHHKSGSVGR